MTSGGEDTPEIYNSDVSLYIEARLHPDDVEDIFTDRFTTEEMRTAWTRKRLKITAYDSSDQAIYPKWAGIRRAWQLEEEGREWWEAGARLADGNGKIAWGESEYGDGEEEGME